MPNSEDIVILFLTVILAALDVFLWYIIVKGLHMPTKSTYPIAGSILSATGGILLFGIGVLVAMFALPHAMDLSEARLTRGAHNWTIGALGLSLLPLGLAIMFPAFYNLFLFKKK